MKIEVPTLQHDCNACSALCCVVFPFDKDQGFGFDKEALTPCAHLGNDFTCSIHRDLDAKGFKGCIHYSCHGAGQRVTRVFGEMNWRSNPERAGEVYAMFSDMQRLHRLHALLETAIAAMATSEWVIKLSEQRDRLEQQCMCLELSQPVDIEAISSQVHTLLKQLATEPTILALKTAG